MSLRIVRVTAADTADLRRAVLRSGDPRPLQGDEAQDVVHLAAYGEDGALIGCGNLRLDPPPFPADGPTWRLRGMATDPNHRGEGVGAAILQALIDHARGEGGTLLWCNARTPAQRFYERHGLQPWGEPWDDPEIGPHIVMWMPLGES